LSKGAKNHFAISLYTFLNVLRNGTLNCQFTAVFENWVIIICFSENFFMGHFSGHFEVASTFLTPKLSLAALWTILKYKMSWPPQNIP
jgi:hypothetical protein